MGIVRPHVLVAEDELSAQVELIRLLWRAGVRVEIADCDPTLRLIVDEGALADVLIMSAEFCGCAGGDWLAELSRRPRWQEVPVIATTSAPRSIFATALRAASVPVLTKPVDARSLRLALQQLLLQQRRQAAY